jgi:hypothetical protein
MHEKLLTINFEALFPYDFSIFEIRKFAYNFPVGKLPMVTHSLGSGVHVYTFFN